MSSTASVQSIVDRATAELGIATSSFETGLVTQTGEQSLALLNSIGEDLVRIHDWQFLESVQTINGDGTTTAFALPDDFKRIVNQTFWSTTESLPAGGPMNAQEWGWVQFGIVSTGISYRYRILSNQVHIYPTPSAGHVLKFYYISKNWVTDGDGSTLKDTLTSSDDVPMFDRSLMIKGLKVRIWAQKGFDISALSDEFNFVLAAEKAQNQGSPTLELTGGMGDVLIRPHRNIPEGNW